MHRWQAGRWTITRIPDPGFDWSCPRTTRRGRRCSAPWLHARFVTDDWALRIGSSAIVVSDGEHTVLVDPWLAFDDPSRFGPRREALAEAGWEPDEVDLVINSHIDGRPLRRACGVVRRDLRGLSRGPGDPRTATRPG